MKNINTKDTAVNLSAMDFDLEKAYFYDEYNVNALIDTASQDVPTFPDKDIVFQSVNWQELVYLLQQKGNYLILFGGAWCGNTRAAATYINQLAHEYGVHKIYNFDFRLDGSTSDTNICETNRDADGKTPGEQFNHMYGELVSRYLTNLSDWVEYKADGDNALTYTNASGQDVTVAKVQVPFLFLYNRDNAVDNSGNNKTGATYPIVFGFEEMVKRDANGVYATVTDNGKPVYITDAYVERLRRIFDFIRDNGIELDSFTDADFVRLVFNEEAYSGIEGVEYRIGNPIFEKNDQINIRVVTYRQLLWLLQQEGDSLIFFGGGWCANTQAAIAIVNRYAVVNDAIVYWYDPAWESYYTKNAWGYTKDSDPRCGGRYGTGPYFVPYYVHLVKNYLPNLTVSADRDFMYMGEMLHAVYHFDYTDAQGATYSVGTFQVPYLLSYNKDAVDSDGLAAPITAFVEDAIYHLEKDAEDYIYNADNYASYTGKVYHVFDVFASRLGLTAKELDKDDIYESDATNTP